MIQRRKTNEITLNIKKAQDDILNVNVFNFVNRLLQKKKQ